MSRASNGWQPLSGLSGLGEIPARPVIKRLGTTAACTSHRARSSSEQTGLPGSHPWRTASRLVRSCDAGRRAGTTGEALPSARLRERIARAGQRTRRTAQGRSSGSAALLAALGGNAHAARNARRVRARSHQAMHLLLLRPWLVLGAVGTSCPLCIGNDCSPRTVPTHTQAVLPAADCCSPGWAPRRTWPSVHIAGRLGTRNNHGQSTNPVRTLPGVGRTGPAQLLPILMWDRQPSPSC